MTRRPFIASLRDIRIRLENGTIDELPQTIVVNVGNGRTVRYRKEEGRPMADPTNAQIVTKAQVLWEKRPELRPKGLFRNSCPGWRLGTRIISDELAYMLIEVACWRALPGVYHVINKQTGVVTLFRRWFSIHQDGFITDTVATAPYLTEALIAACMEAEQ